MYIPRSAIHADWDMIRHCSPEQQPPVFGPAQKVLTLQIVPGPWGVPKPSRQPFGDPSRHSPLG
jgi:hypothetical protein